jgi:hypothetical protein
MHKTLFALFIISISALFTACGPGSNAGEQTIKSTKAGDLTVTLASPNGQLKSGKPVDVGAASLNFHMGAMGTMAEMNDRATLTTTDTPGKYRAQVRLQMGGTWEAQIAYQGSQGTGKASMNVQAK